MKRHLIHAVGALGAAVLLSGSPAAESVVSFPILLAGQDCINAQGCYDTEWTLENTATFTESWGLDGSWIYSVGANMLIMQYTQGMNWDYEYRGVRTGTCFEGVIFDVATGTQAGVWNACLVP